MLNKGHFIVVEGLEGAGKSTALSTIQNYLRAYTKELIITREPGGTHVGETARRLLKESLPSEPLDARTELLLLYASRVQLLEQVIRPALTRGCWVLGDRFELSTWAYQGGGRKLDGDLISHLSSFCLQGFKPDLIIFLDISPEQGLKRALRRGKADRIEQESLAFFKEVHMSYHEHIKTMENVMVIDASQPLQRVKESICEALDVYIHKHSISL